MKKLTQELVKKLIKSFSEHNYNIVNQYPYKSRCNSADLQRRIKEYGKTLIPLPDIAFDSQNIIPLINYPKKFVSEINLWTIEGKSDLSIILTISEDTEAVIEIDDLRVL